MRRGTGPVVPLPGWAEPTEADPAGGEGGRAARVTAHGWAEPTEADPAGGEGGRAAREAAHGWAEPTEADPAGGGGGRAARVRVDRAVLSVVCWFMASRLVGLSES